jgi:hypothetical protein
VLSASNDRGVRCRLVAYACSSKASSVRRRPRRSRWPGRPIRHYIIRFAISNATHDSKKIDWREPPLTTPAHSM